MLATPSTATAGASPAPARATAPRRTAARPSTTSSMSVGRPERSLASIRRSVASPPPRVLGGHVGERADEGAVVPGASGPGGLGDLAGQMSLGEAEVEDLDAARPPGQPPRRAD